MTNQALFYQDAVAVTRERHRDWSLDSSVGYAFSRNTNSVPLVAIEFVKAAAAFPVVFVNNGKEALPVALLGLKDRQNLLISDSGDWTGGYIPAFVRRYPFIFASSDGGENFTLCIDEGFAGLNREGRGDALFNADGKNSPFLDNMVAFLQEYEAQHRLTQEFCKRLADLDLFKGLQASVSLESGESLSVTGFHAVDRERLCALDGSAMSKLVNDNHMDLIYAHLHSLENFGELVNRLSAMAA